MIKERFQHFGEYVFGWFKLILDVACLITMDIIKPSDPQFREVPNKIRNDVRYWPYFKNCIRVINGTHDIPIVIPKDRQTQYIGRKDMTTQCYYIMWFQYLFHVCMNQMGKSYSWCVGLFRGINNARIGVSSST